MWMKKCDRKLLVSLAARQGFKPLANSKSPLKRTKIISCLIQKIYLNNNLIPQSSSEDFSFETGVFNPWRTVG